MARGTLLSDVHELPDDPAPWFELMSAAMATINPSTFMTIQPSV